MLCHKMSSLSFFWGSLGMELTVVRIVKDFSVYPIYSTGKVVKHFLIFSFCNRLPPPPLKNVFGRNKAKLLTINYIAVAVHQGCPPFLLHRASWRVMFNAT